MGVLGFVWVRLYVRQWEALPVCLLCCVCVWNFVDYTFYSSMVLKFWNFLLWISNGDLLLFRCIKFSILKNSAENAWTCRYINKFGDVGLIIIFSVPLMSTYYMSSLCQWFLMFFLLSSVFCSLHSLELY